jgi:hypothetical protein
MDFCLHYNSNILKFIVWSDEKRFVLEHTSQRVWIEEGDDIPMREVKSTHTSVMVWAGVWYNGRTELCICDETINHQVYIRILRDYLLPVMPTHPRFLFMQDNARPHSPVTVQKFLFDFGVKLLQPWPAYSPDLNPSEHC